MDPVGCSFTHADFIQSRYSLQKINTIKGAVCSSYDIWTLLVVQLLFVCFCCFCFVFWGCCWWWWWWWFFVVVFLFLFLFVCFLGGVGGGLFCFKVVIIQKKNTIKGAIVLPIGL